MKAIILLLIISMTVFSITAQTPVKNQPGQAYFDMLEKTIIEKTIPETELLALKPSAIPENLMDTLKKYDWAYVGGYFYADKKFTSYKNLYKEYKIMRFDENGGKLEFMINGYQNFVINSLNFQNPPRSHWSIIKNANSWYIEQKLPDGKEYQKILSYNDGVLVYVISKTGKLTDNAVYFREVYASVPKGFTWRL
jgi:hypothetical protein